MSYDESWNRPHQPGESDTWQESDCYWFFDSKSRVGGQHRIGQFTNTGVGQVMTFIFKEGGKYFRQITDIPGSECSRSEKGQRVASHAVETLGDGRMHYTFTDPDCDLDLVFCEQFYTPRNWKKAEDENLAAIEEGFNSEGHLEVSGRVKGKVRLGDEVYEIDALGHRDRSWGNRNWGVARQGRQISGTFGPQLSWSAVVGQMENEEAFVFKVGFVARHGKTTDVKDIKVVAGLDYDGLTAASMKVRFILEDGSHVDLSGYPVQGFLNLFKGPTDTLLVSQNVAEVVREGELGMSNFEVQIRPRKGDYVPTEQDVSLTRIREGLHDTADYSTLRW